MRQGVVRSIMLALGVCLMVSTSMKAHREHDYATELVIFSYNRPLQLYALLESVQKKIRGLQAITVLYRADDAYAKGYELVKERFSSPTYVRQGTQPGKDFKKLLMEILRRSNASHVMFAVDDQIVTRDIDIADATQQLVAHDAYGFYLRLGENITSSYALREKQTLPPGEAIADDLYIWKLGNGGGCWNYPHTVDMTIYPRNRIIGTFESLAFQNPNSLEAIWASKKVHDKVGICFRSSAVVNLPLNLVNKSKNRHENWLSPGQLLDKFIAGFKIDIDDVAAQENHAPHMGYIPKLIPRAEEHPRTRSIARKEKSFVVIVPSYNNRQWYQKNLNSIMQQKYPYFRVIYIDAYSPDGTGDLVEAYSNKHGFSHKITLLRNKKRAYPLENIYMAMHMCADYEIALVVDGDDFLNGDQVLTKLNDVYQDDNIWMTYGQFRHWPGRYASPYRGLKPQVIACNSYRESPWETSHLRTNYAWLFKLIDKERLQMNGEFYPMAGDQAYMYCMLELAGEHSCFISDVLYWYNVRNGLNENKVNPQLQRDCEAHIRKQEKYQPLAHIPDHVMCEE